MDFGGGDEIRFERAGRAGVITLTRPKALNALTRGMVLALHRALDAWAVDPDVALVIVKGEGRAFCAGGDIMQVYESGRRGEPLYDFFADEYRMNAALARFPKPYVALIDGIVMGGGVGISAHGSHRVMTENAVFAMPEVGIGFFPDVGGSHFLSRLKGSFGVWLALTGDRIRAGDACRAGLATHVVNAADLPALEAALCESGEPDKTLKRFVADLPQTIDEAAVKSIALHFSLETVEDIVSSLTRDAARDEFAAKAAETVLKRSPTSLKVTLRQILTGAMLSMDECMVMEFRILTRMLQGHDFYEGIRCALVDKGATPQWQPAALEAVSEAEVDAYFAPLGDGDLRL